mmetsp:Transcript_72433/g.120746  ORF Transcript_72433/g.120746 Transcript_72433/m.120746 type:complete len:452 (+) Transcript_72433:111-1466(+)|eukprot:CAMPEP_0119327876 /NCGR_PEP_ID=MMETSP1333-20130426/71905_1 /TAXON_ID=418940 /ORGANISM="Scyphosphaera apsteinii, Strain RCC1455" /LENGTH=451 /DNA_ID=CAMNT_0007336591 /DNA_START=114 /DNA_END=1472 /DNA_ORIENTATION=+
MTWNMSSERSSEHSGTTGVHRDLAAENDVLLSHLARLAVFVEGQGHDPVEILQGDGNAVTSAFPFVPANAATTTVAANEAGSSSGVPTTDKPSSMSWFYNMYNILFGTERFEQRTTDTFKWDGEAAAEASESDIVEELTQALVAAGPVRECHIECAGLSVLPGSQRAWAPLARSLTVLALNGNMLTELPPAIGMLSSLEHLGLECNLLRNLPDAVVELRGLRQLWLGCNQLSGLPEGFGRLTALRELYMVNNELCALPITFGELQALEKLEASANDLQQLPGSFGKLSSLQQLWLRDNAFDVFPIAICALDRLHSLDIRCNHISVVPRTIGTMSALRLIRLDGNPLSFPPIETVSLGSEAVLEFVRGYRQADVLTTEDERSRQQVAASRSKLSLSLAQYHWSTKQSQSNPSTISTVNNRHMTNALPVEANLPTSASASSPSMRSHDFFTNG